MIAAPRKIDLSQWDAAYAAVESACPRTSYDGPLGRHVSDGDTRLCVLKFDNSPAALRLWNFLLTEEDRLADARSRGKKIVGTMKDLGTVPVMAYASENLVAFYPDGAWWAPCVMENRDGLLEIADRLGVNESFCPVRAMLGAFVAANRFPIPDMLCCSVGAVCDDLSAIAQRLESLGFPILWWEIPGRRDPGEHDLPVSLPCDFRAPAAQVAMVRAELERVRHGLEELAGAPIDAEALRAGIRAANDVRARLQELRQMVFTAEICPLPALEMLVAEMLAIHFCSDRAETLAVLDALIDEVRRRVHAGAGVLPKGAARVYWVNPVADLRAMNLLEDCGGRVCGTEYLFCHTLASIDESLPPMEALARTALADPMVGSAAGRARHVCAEAARFGAEAVLVSRIPGASHCATEGTVIADAVQSKLAIPVLELEVPSTCDAVLPSLRTRIEALVETVLERRKR